MENEQQQQQQQQKQYRINGALPLSQARAKNIEILSSILQVLFQSIAKSWLFGPMNIIFRGPSPSYSGLQGDLIHCLNDFLMKQKRRLNQTEMKSSIFNVVFIILWHLFTLLNLKALLDGQQNSLLRYVIWH